MNAEQFRQVKSAILFCAALERDAEFVKLHDSPGISIVSRKLPIGKATDWRVLYWEASEAEEYRSQVIEACSPDLPRRILADMSDEVIGTVRGNIIALDEPIPPLEGRRLRVILEPLPVKETRLTSEEQERLLREWAATGPQGPLDAEGPWPDESR